MTTPNLAVSPQAIRDELTDMVMRDLLGPACGPEEELNQREDRFTGRYMVGMLAPKSTPVPAEEQDHLETYGSDDAEVGATEASTPSSTTFFPNSIGMSFVVEPDAKAREQDCRKDEAWVFQPKMWVLDAGVPPLPIFVQRLDRQHDEATVLEP